MDKYVVMGQESLVTPEEKLIPVKLTNADSVPKFLLQATLENLEVVDPSKVLTVEEQTERDLTAEKKAERRNAVELKKLLEEMNIAPNLSEAMKERLEALV